MRENTQYLSSQVWLNLINVLPPILSSEFMSKHELFPLHMALQDASTQGNPIHRHVFCINQKDASQIKQNPVK